MAQIWQCDRCYRTSRSGDADDPPPEWVNRDMPVRGSEGAKSSMRQTLCDSCDQALYLWFCEGQKFANEQAKS